MRPGRGAWALALASGVLIATGACTNSPTAASLDVADARAQGVLELERVRREVGEQYRKASEEVAAARRRAHLTAIEGEREIALAQARVDFDVTSRSCEALAEEARRACVDNARRRFDAARELAARIDYAYLD